MTGNFMTMKEFIDEFRAHMGDTTCSIEARSIIAWTNTALRRLARSRGCDKLFRFQDTFQLAPMNTDGSAAASWFLRGVTTDGTTTAPRIGTVINIESIKFLSADGCNTLHDICHLSPRDFDREYPMPELESAGIPCAYTVNQFGGDTKLIFNCPISGHFTVSMTYTAFHPRITSEKDLLRIPYSYVDILMECVKILQAQEAADYATARALYEDWDFLISELRESLAMQYSGAGLRQVKASF